MSETESATQPDLGRPRLHFRRVDSTNERARALAIAGAPHGTFVSAAEQTAGRGRQGRGWAAPAGSALLCSLIVRDPPPLLSLIAGVAVCDVVGEDALLKWPNDVVLPERAIARDTEDAPEMGPRRGAEGQAPKLRKLAGILVEGRPQDAWAVLGIGLNVAVRVEQLPPELRTRAATMGLAGDAIEPTLQRLLLALERHLVAPVETLLEAWRERDALRGREVSWESGHGRAGGIDERGRLLVALADGSLATLDAGEVHLAL
jgi:BirA family transcriptional regulator, biotin operon repressor / biotin---[acetyl-CoA-carboxylase] ligase